MCPKFIGTVVNCLPSHSVPGSNQVQEPCAHTEIFHYFTQFLQSDALVVSGESFGPLVAE
jgi:hypothetical protein